MTTTTEHLFQGNKNWSSLPKSLYVDVHGIIICNSPKLEIVWYRSMTEQLKKQTNKQKTLVQPTVDYNRTLKRKTIGTQDNLNEPWES